ncbi:MAG TPA: DUF4145 domain-containing protein [Candidatus Binatia bacterium]|nr:DUF4145 domain-containing protein [Candidatus Binatia bacterium]
MGVSLNLEGEIKKILCVSCNVLTSHRLEARHRFKVQCTDDVDDVVVGADEIIPIRVYRISVWVCGGCGEPTMEWEIGHGESEPGDSFENSLTEYFPRRFRGALKRKELQTLNPEMRRLYGEVVISFNEDCVQLCNLGLRSLIEAVCHDKGIRGGGLNQKLNELKRFVPSENIIEALHVFREWGNDAAHPSENAKLPKIEDLRKGIEVVEDLIASLYDLDYRASKFRRNAHSAESAK